MTPAGRINAAIELLDRIATGELADRALASWGRNNRYAGSKDRRAIGDIVYDVLRRKRSLAALGGGENGRALLIGYLRSRNETLDDYFGNGPYAPDALTAAEQGAGRTLVTGTAEALDVPQWLWSEFHKTYADGAVDIAKALQTRAPIFLRVNLAKITRDAAIKTLGAEDIVAQPAKASPSALRVTQGERRIQNSAAYKAGLIELQDASSQAVADLVPLTQGQSLLDYCAGGGGKTLAVASRVNGEFYAHDADVSRLKDLPVRAARAGQTVDLISTDALTDAARFDAVLLDVPCSGSGSWRRDPQGKWLLTEARLSELTALQAEILNKASGFVTKGGALVYATCSVIERENGAQVAEFLAQTPNFELVSQNQFLPSDDGDGFFCAVMSHTG